MMACLASLDASAILLVSALLKWVFEEKISNEKKEKEKHFKITSLALLMERAHKTWTCCFCRCFVFASSRYLMGV